MAHSPMNAFPDVIVAILGDRYPELRHVGESSFRYQLNSIRRKYIPNHGKLIYPHKVRTISGGTFGREFVSHEIGDFFIMYSEAQEKYLELCRHDTCQIMIDGTFKCVPPEYSQLLICVIYSYEKDFFMPIFQCFMSSKELPAYNFAHAILRKQK